MGLFRTRAERQANRAERQADRQERVATGNTGAAARQADRDDREHSLGNSITSTIEDVLGITAAGDAAASQTDAINRALAAAGWVMNEETGEMEPPGTPVATDLDPYVDAGESALGAQGDLLGLNGPEAQAAAMAGLEGSPMFSSMMQQGENVILQNASATGGLRGGNTQGALGLLGPQVMSSLVQNQMGNLGGMSGMGLGAAGTGAGLDAAALANIQQLLLNQGDVDASGDLAGYQGIYDMISELLGFGVSAATGLPT